ncbi:MAG: F0F1 ATP synthase subunit gamma [Candidatus Saccharimonadales bacterium]
MKRPQELAREEELMANMVQLTSIFESIASMRISQIKNQVLGAQKFFNELWHIYSQLRVDGQFKFGRRPDQKIINKDLFIIITAEGGFSGDIDQKLIELMRKQYDRSKADIIVIGHHGAIQLSQVGIGFKKYFKLPTEDRNINTLPLATEIQQYKATTIFYQTYVSLMVQDVKRLNLDTAIEQRSKTAEGREEIINEENYIFEPSTYEVADHLERSMVQITLGQLILESKLAQYASRFRAMSAAHNKADESLHDVHLEYNRAKRAIKDERLKEIVNGLRLTRSTT